MPDYRMLDKLQEIRRRVYDEKWCDDCDPARFDRMHQIIKLLDDAIDLNNQINRERLGLEQVPPEADAGSWD